ncbi:hypothetical protein BKA70DRAFT_570030 [Coprinopsis sp. MPI-PUGE-AT-0042]|nr:hypothetical protein BKA70DRAFT_570030 [Coprinopsis sp. MPI-PUGE-AT-0042]
MDDDAWSLLLKDHPIFEPVKGKQALDESQRSQLELSTNTLPKFTTVEPNHDDATPSGRRQVMLFRDADLVVAVGKELRITSLSDIKLGRSTRRSYKVLHTPNINFEIHHLALNPNGKLLAVSGAFQVAVVVMPRPGYNRLVPETIDCKAVQVGNHYHASEDSAPIAKVDWHPWGDAGSTLLVMTTDGKLREYDISFDAEEPQQTLSFVSPRKSTFAADDEAEREVASFTLGKGKADWGPLTVYALMSSGDVYAICPYLPQNAVVPSAYVHSLECFISAKQEFLSQSDNQSSHLSTLYDYQRKYVNALTKQLPPGIVFPAASRNVSVHPPKTISNPVARQGPFLLQPSPRILDGSEGGNATDIIYLEFGTDDDAEGEGRETDHLGVIMVSYQDGKVDVSLDVEKVEARWNVKQLQQRNEFPMLAVYESIDLGLVSSLKQLSQNPNEPLLDLLQGNHPVFLADPIHDNIVYVYHAFGVHILDISSVLENLAQALRIDDDEAESSLTSTLEQSAQTLVQPILATFSIDRRCSNPVVAVAIPNDVYLTYSIFILTSVMRLTVFPLNLHADSPPAPSPPTLSKETPAEPIPEDRRLQSPWLKPADGPPSYVSLLTESPYKVPAILKPSGLPALPKLSLPPSTSSEFMLTPDTLRYIGKTIEQISGQIQELYIAQRAAEARASLQKNEQARQANKCREMQNTLGKLKEKGTAKTEERLKQVEETQKGIMKRLDRMLQSLMEKASPELSEHEKKWFEELKRMKVEILGQGRYDEGSLATRVKALERDYTRLTPSLKALLDKENQRQSKTHQLNQSLGFSQAFEYGQRSNDDAKRISKLESELNRMAAKLDVSLGRPPSAQ